VTKAAEVATKRAQSLEAPKRHEEGPVGRQTADHGEDTKGSGAGQVEAHAAPSVGQATDRDQEDTQHEKVGGLYPERFGVAQVQRFPHLRKRHRDNGGIERAHERSDGGEAENAPTMTAQFAF
jgi:hypothetical protein